MNVLTIVILAIFLMYAASGWKKGLVKKMAGVVSLLLASFLVSAALPYITELIKTETPVYQYIVVQCEGILNDKNVNYFLNGEENGSSIDREEIRYLLNYYGMDSSVVDDMSDAELEELANQYFQEYMEQQNAGTRDLTKIEQTKLIQNLPVPNFLQDMMLNYNNSEGYRKLDVTTFEDYLIHFFANVVLNIVAFVATLFIVQLVLWTGITALDLFARLPLISFINRIGGLGIGIMQGLFAVWLIFLAISVFSSTEIGIMLMGMIDESTLLQPMYESNLFLKMVLNAISNIM